MLNPNRKTQPVPSAQHPISDGDLLSIVVPAFNEQEVLPAFHARLSAVLDSLPLESEVLYVNDGSKDTTLEVMKILRAHDPRIAILDLSRNFGKEIAMTAGLDHARGDAVVVIDADLQDPPELIPEMMKHWREGWDVVYAQRIERRGETLLKKLTAHWFYRLMQRVGRVRIPENVGDFRLLEQKSTGFAPAASGTPPLHERPLCLDRFPPERDPLPAGPTLCRKIHLGLLAALEFRSGWDNLFHHHSP